jgi:hypothetical protein
MGLSKRLVLNLAQREMRRLADRIAGSPILNLIRNDHTYPMRASGLTPDPWQAELIGSPARQIVALCTRRAGKSQAAGCRVLSRSLTRPRHGTLMFSPTEDQSKELLNYVRQLNEAIGCPVPLVRESLSELVWANGSWVKAKADSPKGSRGYTPNLIVIDEGAQVSDDLYLSVTPMLVMGQADIMALSTPFGKLGWFFDLWSSPAKMRNWSSFKITAYDCPRIDPLILEEHKATMPPRWFKQEYEVEFNDAVDSVFENEVIESACKTDDAFMPLAL